MPDVSAFDVLVPRTPRAPEVSEEERAAILSVKADEVKVRDDVVAALDSAIQAWLDAKGEDAAITAQAATEAVQAVSAAEALGIRVNRAELAEMGLLPPEPVVDLDAVPDPEPEAPAEEVTEADLDPLSVTEPGVVPVYNPAPHIITLGYDGSFWPLRPQSVSRAGSRAVDNGIGLENTGGPYHKFGVRRLYTAEERFADAAAAKGMSIEEFVRHRNETLVFLADGVWARAAERLTYEEKAD